MLTVEIKVNIAMIGHLYIVNESQQYSHTGKQEYRYEYYKPDEGIVKGKVRHNAEDGALRLIQVVIDDIKGIE